MQMVPIVISVLVVISVTREPIITRENIIAKDDVSLLRFSNHVTQRHVNETGYTATIIGHVHAIN